MTTTVQPTGRSLNAILDEAREQIRQSNAEERAKLEQQVADRQLRSVRELGDALRSVLGYEGIAVGGEEIEGENGDYEIVYPVATIGTLTFAFRKSNQWYFWGGEYEESALCVKRQCAKGCNKPVWVAVTDAQSLVHTLDREHEHAWDCTDERNKPAPAQSTLGDRIVGVEALLDEIEQAALASGTAHAIVQQLEDERPLLKAACIGEMIGTPNPLGKPGAVHSASSAEAVVEQNERYWQHRQKQANAEVDRWKALGQWHAARLRAELHVGLAKAGAQ